MSKGLNPYPTMKDSGVPSLGEVPAHWDLRTVGALGSLFKGNGGNKRDEVTAGIPCVRYGDLYTQHEFFITRSKGFISEERAGAYTPIRYGDLLFAASGETIEDIGRSAVNLIESEARCGGDVLVLRPQVPIMPRYLGYAADSAASRIQKACMGRGFTVVHIYGGELKRLLLPLPPLPEQAAIVHFLDHADRRIRCYIRAKQKAIKLLEEHERAVIQRAVTRGLDPDVKLIPSGLPWLGDVPAHWALRRLRQIAKSFRTGPFGSTLHQADYTTGGIPVINPTHMRMGALTEDVRCSVPSETARRLSEYAVDKHDLLFARRGELGRCALIRDPEVGWIIGTGTIRVRLSYGEVSPEYLIQSLQVAWVREFLSSFSVGATMESLNTTILGRLPLLVPPKYEQASILEHITVLGEHLRRAAAACQREIALAREYRARLIADVVTGKLDVREAAARLPRDAEDSDEPDDPGEQSYAEEAEPEELDPALAEAEA